ncbi:MAG: glycosyltransferase family 4 protein [Candidatus Riflebacteria bacterium]|nr:glycosyltransferase family 4 protein [Candidatus Riflebacteria bacterium]
MKIIQILNSPNWSGASSYCVTLSERLMRLGHEILLLTEPGKPLDEARRLGIPCDDTIRLNHRNPLLYVHAMKRMQTVFKDFQPDIISSHINEGAWMAGMMARKAAPHAAVVRTRGDIDPPKSHFINRYVHHRWTDHIIVSSRLHKRLCTKLLDFPADKIDVVYGAIDINRFKPEADPSRAFRAEIGATPETVVICMTARLDPVKGHEYALSALARVASMKIPFLAVFLGYENSCTFAWLRQEATRLGLADHIRTFDRRYDLPAIISSIDVGLIASTGSEANCRAALEFMACGKPVVTTSVGVIPEIVIEDEQGFLCPPLRRGSTRRRSGAIHGRPCSAHPYGPLGPGTRSRQLPPGEIRDRH